MQIMQITINRLKKSFSKRPTTNATAYINNVCVAGNGDYKICVGVAMVDCMKNIC